jgi:hypothetical protein
MTVVNVALKQRNGAERSIRKIVIEGPAYGQRLTSDLALNPKLQFFTG